MFELATPLALWLLPLPLLLIFLLPAYAPRPEQAVRVPFYSIVAAQALRPVAAKRIASLMWLSLVWTLLVVALAGPRWVGEPLPLKRQGYNIMLVLDVSGSMEQDDFSYNGAPATRLETVVRAASAFVNERVGDRLGLIVFGTRAYLQTPLTFDRKNVLERLKDASVGLAGNTTSIGDALGLAVKRMQNTPRKGRVAILLTDGVSNTGMLTPLRAAALARDADIRVYTIGLGADEPMQNFPDFFAGTASPELDEATLQEIARLTRGRYFRATDTQSLANIYDTINRLEPVEQEQSSLRPQIEYYPWPLAGALLLGFIAAMRGRRLHWRGVA